MPKSSMCSSMPRSCSSSSCRLSSSAAPEKRTFPAGSTLVLYTDGLVERRDADLDTGIARLREAHVDLVGLPLEELLDELLERLVQGRPEDDVALVAVRLRSLGG